MSFVVHETGAGVCRFAAPKPSSRSQQIYRSFIASGKDTLFVVAATAGIRLAGRWLWCCRWCAWGEWVRMQQWCDAHALFSITMVLIWIFGVFASPSQSSQNPFDQTGCGEMYQFVVVNCICVMDRWWCVDHQCSFCIIIVAIADTIDLTNVNCALVDRWCSNIVDCDAFTSSTTICIRLDLFAVRNASRL